MTIEKVKRLTADNPFAEWEAQAFTESGVAVKAEPEQKKIQLMVRFEIWDGDELFFVHDHADTTKDQSVKGRPPGWGLPGGKVKPEETPREALEHEKGELGHPITGTPIYVRSFDVVHKTWIERIFVFRTAIDRNTVIARTEEEAKEVDKSEFIPFRFIPNAKPVDTRDDAPPQAEEEDGVYATYHFFASHKNLGTIWGIDRGFRFREGQWQSPAARESAAPVAAVSVTAN